MVMLLKLYHWFHEDIYSIPIRLIGFVGGIAILLMPLFFPDSMQAPMMRIVIVGSLYAIYAASWDLLAGFTGQVNLGHALFFGVAAYTAAILNINLGWPPLVTIPIGAIVAAAAGVLMCLPALRMRGIYLSLVTLALPIILSGFVTLFKDFTGGEYGLSGISGLGLPPLVVYYGVFAFMILLALIMWKITDTRSKALRTGVILRAIREDEIAARMCGIRTTRYKVLIFVLSGLFCGLAGGLYAHYFRVVGPSTLELAFSFNAIVWTVFGGIGTIYGPIAGVFILYPLTEFARFGALADYRFIMQALVLILVLIFMPQGITTWIRDNIEQVCPRCKLINFTLRRNCRACSAPLHPEKEHAAGEEAAA
ncbi:MAG: branched-chain amino acid ABC transporter permease [Dehalococcoidia bacterium]|jgi:branched-chain amino acid transport system permease protein